MRNVIALLLLLLTGAGLAGEAPGYVFPPSGGGGTISSGTAGYIAKYTASNTLGASGINDAGAGEYTFAANGVSGPALNLNVANITTPGRIWTVADRSQTWTAPTANDTGADVMWGASAADKTALHLQAQSAQSVAILKISDSTGALMLDVGSTGVLTLTRNCVIDGSADAVQLRVQGHATQTNYLVLVEESDGDDLFRIDNTGNAHFLNNSGQIKIRAAAGNGSLSIGTGDYRTEVSADGYGMYSLGGINWAPGGPYNNPGDMFNVSDTRLSRHSAGSVKFNAGAGGNGGDFVLTERSGAPATNPADGTEVRPYMKDDKFIIQYNHGGTIKYRYLDLTGTDAIWTYTTTAP